MTQAQFKKKTQALFKQHEKLLSRRNSKAPNGNGIFDRYTYPVLTAEHAPLIWRYDFDQQTNPYLQERMGINAAFNAGAIEHDGKVLVLGGTGYPSGGARSDHTVQPSSANASTIIPL